MKRKLQRGITIRKVGYVMLLMAVMVSPTFVNSAMGKSRGDKALNQMQNGQELAALCYSEDFESAGFPYPGWDVSGCSISNSPANVKSGLGALIMDSPNGYFVLPVIGTPQTLNVNIGRSANNSSKTLLVQVSTTSSSTGFQTVATYDHSNIAERTYYQYTIDLAAYSGASNVWIRFEKISATVSPWRIDNISIDCAPCQPAIITSNPIDATSCNDGAVVYTIQASGTSLTYQWEQSADNGLNWLPLTDGANISGSLTSSVQLLSTSGLVSGYSYRCIVSSSCGNPATSSSASLVKQQTPVAGSISGATFVCQPFPVQQVYSIAPVPNATSYDWSFNTGTTGATFIGSTTGTSVTVEFNTTSNSTYVLRVSATNACGTSPLSNILIRKTISTPQISGTPTACAGSTQIYTVPSAISGATGYTWTAPPGCLINGSLSPVTTSGTSVVVQFHSLFVSGSVCVVANDPCGGSTSQRCMDVSTIPASPVAILGGAAACPGASGVVFSVAPVTNATFYNWTVPSGMTITNGIGTNQITVDLNSSYVPGNVCVQSVNGCGFSANECKLVTIDLPGRPAAISGNLYGVCRNLENYTVTPVAGATSYTWTVPSGATILSGQGTTSVQIDFDGAVLPGNVCCVANNGCGSGPSRCVIVNGVPEKPEVTSGASVICANQQGEIYSVTPVYNAASYNWTVPAGATIVSGAGTSSIVVNFGANGGNVSVKSLNFCGQSGTYVYPVTMNCRISGENVQGAFEVYPNPVGDLLNYKVSAWDNSKGSIIILDVNGKIILEEPVYADSEILTGTINTSGYSKGLYLLKISSEKGTLIQQKFIVR
jgi:hypothetical protein